MCTWFPPKGKKLSTSGRLHAESTLRKWDQARWVNSSHNYKNTKFSAVKHCSERTMSKQPQPPSGHPVPAINQLLPQVVQNPSQSTPKRNSNSGWTVASPSTSNTERTVFVGGEQRAKQVQLNVRFVTWQENEKEGQDTAKPAKKKTAKEKPPKKKILKSSRSSSSTSTKSTKKEKRVEEPAKKPKKKIPKKKASEPEVVRFFKKR